MNTNYIDITILLDRSGSMWSCKTDMEGALCAYLKEVRKQCSEKDIRVSLFEFNDDLYSIFTELRLSEIEDGRIVINPAGCTALYDAMGKAITYTGCRLASKLESNRPAKVLFIVITDGEENSSRELSSFDIRNATEHQMSVYSWEFIYLGANQDVFKASSLIGIPLINTVYYTTDTAGLNQMSETLSSMTVSHTGVVN